MADPFVAEIRIFRSTSLDGVGVVRRQLLPISQNTAVVFATGNNLRRRWEIEFCLTRFQDVRRCTPGRARPVAYDLGEPGGSETVTLLQSEIPALHTGMSVSSQLGLENQVHVSGQDNCLHWAMASISMARRTTLFPMAPGRAHPAGAINPTTTYNRISLLSQHCAAGRFPAA